MAPNPSWLRALGLFLLVAILHFVLSIAGVLAALPAAFDTQAGIWAAPGKANGDPAG
jgi:hypothetical protein